MVARSISLLFAGVKFKSCGAIRRATTAFAIYFFFQKRWLHDCISWEQREWSLFGSPNLEQKKMGFQNGQKGKKQLGRLTLQNCHSTRYSFCGKSNSAATFCYSSTPKLVLNVSNLVCHHVTLYTTSPKLEYRYGKENAGVQSPKPILGGGIIHLPQILKQISLGVASEIVICQR